jgi:hypothetical protein
VIYVIETEEAGARRQLAVSALLNTDSAPEERPDPAWFDALTSVVVDAIITNDAATLEVVADSPDVRRLTRTINDLQCRGQLLSLTLLARRAVERLEPSLAAEHIERGSHSHRVLATISLVPGTDNVGLMKLLGLDKTQVSRVGRTLRSKGLVVVRQMGRSNAWELTPLGRATLDLLGFPEKMPDLADETVETAEQRADLDDLKEVTASAVATLGKSAFRTVAMINEKLGTAGPDVPREIRVAVECGCEFGFDALFRNDKRFNQAVELDVHDDRVSWKVFNHPEVQPWSAPPAKRGSRR